MVGRIDMGFGMYSFERHKKCLGHEECLTLNIKRKECNVELRGMPNLKRCDECGKIHDKIRRFNYHNNFAKKGKKKGIPNAGRPSLH